MVQDVDSLSETQYKQLLKQVKQLLKADKTLGVLDVNSLRIQNYWQIGQSLFQAQTHMPRLKTLHQNSEIMTRLAKDSNTGPGNLYKMLLFYRTWPKKPPTGPQNKSLCWAHYYELLSLDDEAQRHYYHDTALAQNWSRDTLRAAIKMNFAAQSQTQSLHGKIPEQKTPFYTYKAQVSRVLDGDTILVLVQLGFGIDYKAMLRLRGINTPELGEDPTGRAEKAKARLEEILKTLSFVVVKTYKTDVYGRYITDVYYHPQLQDQEAVLSRGVFLNQQILDEGLADWLVM